MNLYQVFTTQEAATFLGCSTRRIQQICNDELLEYRRTDAGFIITLESLKLYRKGERISYVESNDQNFIASNKALW